MNHPFKKCTGILTVKGVFGQRRVWGDPSQKEDGKKTGINDLQTPFPLSFVAFGESRTISGKEPS
jgi:hypothetical protein